MSSPLDSSGSWSGRKLGRAAQVVVVSSVMFSFISYWRTAAIVLCDMSSTAYYIGAIVESEIGQAAPWFILAVLLFSYGCGPCISKVARYLSAAACIGLSKKRWAVAASTQWIVPEQSAAKTIPSNTAGVQLLSRGIG